jgi:hypothetical protein
MVLAPRLTLPLEAGITVKRIWLAIVANLVIAFTNNW